MVNIVNYQLLRGIGLSESVTLKVVAHTRFKTYSPGEVLSPRGVVGLPWRYVLAGVACICSPEYDGKRNVFGIVGSGYWVGEVPVDDTQSTVMEILCMTEVRVLEVPIEFIQEAFNSEFNFCRYVARLLNDRILRQTETALVQRIPEIVDRVTLGLALLCETFLNCSSARASYEPHKREVVHAHQSLPFNQTILGSYCDVSRSNLSQTLKQFAAAGLCQVQYGQVTVLRLEAWMHTLKIHRNRAESVGVGAYETLINVSLKPDYEILV